MGARRSVSVATGVAVALVAVVFCDARAGHTRFVPLASPFDVMLGQASTPFQYRVLVPKLTYFVLTVLPALVPMTRLWLAVAEWLFFVGAFACVHRLASLLAPASTVSAPRVVLGLLAVPFVYLVLPPFRPYYNACDTPSLFFLVACVLALVSERRGLFAGLFLLGTLNRETTLLLLPAWSLAAHRTGTLRRDRILLAVCAVGFVAIKGALAVVYSANPGAGLFQLHHDGGDPSLHVVTNLRALLTLPRSAWFAALVLAPLIPAFALRKNVSHPVLTACLDVAPAAVLLLFIVGNADELRIFADVMWLVFLAVATVAETPARA